MILPLIASALLAGQAAPDPEHCSLAALSRCRDTNRLIWAPGTEKAIRAFLGCRRADLLYKGHSVADQAIDVLGGPPDAPTRVGPYWRFTACRAHSCPEKGALVANPAGRIIAIAILHARCSAARPGNDCFAHDTLTLYTRAAGPDVTRDLKAWATTAIAGNDGTGVRQTTLDAVEVVPV